MGISVDPDRTSCFKSWRTPFSVKELQCFLGSCNFYQRFIRDYSTIAAPLYSLLRKNEAFNWTEPCQIAFDKMKDVLSCLPTLRYPEKGIQIILETDASNLALGAKISQVIKGVDYPISFGSRILNRAERNYCTTDKEILAIIWSLKKFRPYLLGNKFVIRTDHNPLTYLSTFKDNHNRRARWLSILSEYDFDIEYIKGRDNVVADALSRLAATITFGSDRQNIFDAQKKDGDIRIIKNYLNGTPIDYSNYSDFVVKMLKFEKRLTVTDDDVLFYVNKHPRLVVGPGIREELLRQSHASEGAHCGAENLFKLLKNNFFWPGMLDDIVEFTKTCNVCNKIKDPTRNPKSTLHPIPVNGRFKDWHLDFIGPLPLTDDGNRYILIMVDRFTKWCEAVPSANQTAEFAVSCVLNNIVSRFGIPDSIHSDQGRQFESTIFYDICKFLSIKKTRSTPYHPEGNGMAERYVKSLKSKLRALVEDNKRDWDKNLPLALLSLRIIPNDSTKFSPYELVFGQIPETLNRFSTQANTTEVQPTHIFVEDLKIRLSDILNKCDDNIIQSQEKYKRHYDKSIYENSYKPEDSVMVKDKTLKASFEPSYHGPVKIVEVRDLDTVKVENPDLPGTTKIVHHNLLKPVKTDKSEEIQEKRTIKIPESQIEFVKKFLPNLGRGRNVTHVRKD
ncbi:Transposon Ty3-G Gag-Pol polyprotein [Thelohanellus kitauei]|nr:Transposon Ty3-G Gag-Pol polyprotein [Thelohanellus kitauei]